MDKYLSRFWISVVMIGLMISMTNGNLNAKIHRYDNNADLIPSPKSLIWNKGFFDLERCRTIYISSRSLESNWRLMQNDLNNKAPVITSIPKDNETNYIQLKLEPVNVPYNQAEAYRISVTPDFVIIKSGTSEGIFYGLQTLFQLRRENHIPACRIEDYPSFSWRGYMVDVGRNFQSLQQLKQQIGIMARYKLNVFHFHCTENIAWRVEIPGFPQLISPESMTRNKGRFYSVDEIKELIRFCKERHITLVPELDMPGHSQAFTRAFGFEMQCEKGLQIVKSILRSFCETYGLEYMHIGADEIKITNKNFIPEVEALLDSLGKKVIGWSPGVSNPTSSIQQLWSDTDFVPGNNYIDSRIMYISDMDPQTSVVSIFNRQFFDSDRGDSSKLGAEFCLWNDRRVFHEQELLTKNPVYPDMLAFAERIWKGKGYSGHRFFIGEEGREQASEFKEFEGRLLTHKNKYFQELPFSYVKQSHIKWKLIGPFSNNGNLTQSFYPEHQNVSLTDSAGGIYATGGTLWLRPPQWPQARGLLANPEEKCTWYAYTRFQSNSSRTAEFWIDFKNQSRSGADATPPKDQWDYNRSRIWVNHSEIVPPSWKYPGRPSGLLEEPLVDEAYYYRPPHRIKIKRGWNEVLVKLPVKYFDNKDWQVPPKYMFTFIPVQKVPGINWEALNFKFQPDQIKNKRKIK